MGESGCFSGITFGMVIVLLLILWQVGLSNKEISGEYDEFKEVVVKYADQETLDKINQYYFDKAVKGTDIFKLNKPSPKSNDKVEAEEAEESNDQIQTR